MDFLWDYKDINRYLRFTVVLNGHYSIGRAARAVSSKMRIEASFVAKV